MSTDSAASPLDMPDVQWRDRKKKLWLLGLVPPTALFLATALIWAGNALGWQAVTPALWWIGPLLVYVMVPTLDLFVGPDGENPPDELVEALENDRYYRYCTYIYLPFQFASLVFACYLWSADNLSWLGIDGGLGIASKIGLALSVGVVAGIGINTAHELGHKKVELERRLSRIALAQSFYGHFYIEHNRGHHVRVATPEDPASARFGESFWAFLPRTVVGSVRSAWRLERARLERLGKPVWSLRNDVLSAWALSAVLFGGLIAVFGIGIAPYLVIQAVFGFALLEAVNYLEHYGLLRQRTANGRYERCSPAHSWNSDHLVTNIFLYHLQRHSDHHANPTRRYQTLRSMEMSPNLPAGYATMIGLAYIPPLWRKVMDPRVLDHYDGDITRVNIQPSKREAILARYGAAAQEGN
ncbi:MULTISPECIES: alkane 1-monooxygenase [unclassified Rhodococcus (in: high G+C Gram-positive bacteria)]|uniref:alkane 1-monooxygenase n=1 Tax=unclassified Rhodococcus (in: high G+C Gram-positive bacteria) TaxID=192944 RepID=UPI00146BA956|nr:MULTISPECIES: alkane 1-monooxygenase [unclassified Rhodococcus (in: high G+C Gram-positive bacteria)]MBF0661874.1 alkane 1-monooxygenase [Rhodococcus sp. (in: high G+C Gram-positive bacteria)]NME78391.1 alkane 1-monooxygenase [Rhodococcus sp. 105337]